MNEALESAATREPPRPFKLVYCYAHKDAELRDELEKHLSPLLTKGLIERWFDEQIQSGEEWQPTIEAHFRAADIVLLLVSADFLNSKFIREHEIPIAMEKIEGDGTTAIPVILRPCAWQEILGAFQALPRDAVPITKWENRDEAWLSVVEGIRAWINERNHGLVPTVLPELTQPDQSKPQPEIENAPTLDNRSRLLDAVQGWILQRFPPGTLRREPPEATDVDFIKMTRDGVRIDVVVQALQPNFRRTFQPLGPTVTTPRHREADLTLYMTTARTMEEAFAAKSLLTHKLRPFPDTALVVGFVDREGLFVDVWEREPNDQPGILYVLDDEGANEADLTLPPRHTDRHVPTEHRAFITLAPQTVLDILHSRTGMQAKAELGMHIGEWMQVVGSFYNADYYGDEEHARAALLFGERQEMVFLMFDDTRAIEVLKTLSRGDPLTVQGQIANLAQGAVQLERCEIVALSREEGGQDAGKHQSGP